MTSLGRIDTVMSTPLIDASAGGSSKAPVDPRHGIFCATIRCSLQSASIHPRFAHQLQYSSLLCPSHQVRSVSCLSTMHLRDSVLKGSKPASTLATGNTLLGMTTLASLERFMLNEEQFAGIPRPTL